MAKDINITTADYDPLYNLAEELYVETVVKPWEENVKKKSSKDKHLKRFRFIVKKLDITLSEEEKEKAKMGLKIKEYTITQISKKNYSVTKNI